MKQIKISLPRDMYFELLKAAARSTAPLKDADFVEVEEFAKECIESVLADRRMKRIEACA